MEEKKQSESETNEEEIGRLEEVKKTLPITGISKLYLKVTFNTLIISFLLFFSCPKFNYYQLIRLKTI